MKGFVVAKIKDIMTIDYISYDNKLQWKCEIPDQWLNISHLDANHEKFRGGQNFRYTTKNTKQLADRVE